MGKKIEASTVEVPEWWTNNVLSWLKICVSLHDNYGIHWTYPRLDLESRKSNLDKRKKKLEESMQSERKKRKEQKELKLAYDTLKKDYENLHKYYKCACQHKQ